MPPRCFQFYALLLQRVTERYPALLRRGDSTREETNTVRLQVGTFSVVSSMLSSKGLCKQRFSLRCNGPLYWSSSLLFCPIFRWSTIFFRLGTLKVALIIFSHIPVARNHQYKKSSRISLLIVSQVARRGRSWLWVTDVERVCITIARSYSYGSLFWRH